MEVAHGLSTPTEVRPAATSPRLLTDKPLSPMHPIHDLRTDDA